MAQSLTGKVAFVTGAARGIGKATALYLAKEGVNVGLLGRTEASLKDVATEIEGLGVKVAYATADVSSKEQVEAAISSLTNDLGTADILINNAGIASFGTVLENMTFEGGSPKVRNELGLPDLDSEMPNRSIKAPSDNPLFNRHAEEVIANKFDNAVKNAGLSADEVDGTLRIHQSNPSGVCKKCIQGLSNDNVKPGVLKQLSKKYPKLVIKITSELDSNVKVTGICRVR